MRKQNLRFRFSGKIARLLGRESVSSPTVALFELIKNSYDADAKTVKITFSNPETPEEARILICDNGEGMSPKEFEDRWMVIGTDDKEQNPLTSKGRRKIGEKGVGRFSMERLGKRVIIISKKKNSREELVVDIDWEKFEKRGITFDQVDITSEIRKTDELWNGFKVDIRCLRDIWSEEMVRNFVEEVSVLTPPKEVGIDFKVEVSCENYNIHEKNPSNYLFKESKYVFKSEYDGKSVLKYSVDGKSKYGSKNPDMEVAEAISLPNLKCGKLKFILYFFPLGTGIEERYYPEMLRQEISSNLKEVCGVKIYRDGFRVKPYGDRGNDWLELAYRRLHDRQVKYPDNNQVMGYVSISRENNLILDTTTREGLIKNEGYFGMIEFLKRSLWAFANFRKKIEKKEKTEFTKNIEEKKEQFSGYLDDMQLNSEVQTKLNKFFVKALNEAKHEINEEQEQKDLYRNLATLGITAGYSAHEIRPLIDRMNTKIELLLDEAVVKKHKGIKTQLEDMEKILNTNLVFVNLIIGYLKKDKRKMKIINLREVSEGLLKHFSFALDKFEIKSSVECDLVNSNFKMFQIDLESMLMNMIINSVYFLKYKESKRQILIELTEDMEKVYIKFHDSGLGVPKENYNLIFDPLFTTKREGEGTGLGLTIVKELVEYYAGRISIDESKLGGLSLCISLPKENLI